jgi:hypothetical protein
MCSHLATKGFMSNYLVLHQQREVHALIADESDGNDDKDQMDDMVADIHRGYDLESVDPPSKIQNFYKLIAVLEEKVHDVTNVTVLQFVTCLMAMKPNYNFLNQCYNDIIK